VWLMFWCVSFMSLSNAALRRLIYLTDTAVCVN
jgi:hypothetical protein